MNRLVGTTLVALLVLGGPASAQEFLRGDANSDRSVSIADADYVLKWLFLGHDAPDCLRSADADASSTVDLTDAIQVLNHLVLGGPTPCAPFPEPGVDDTNDALDCESWGDGTPLADDGARLSVSGGVADADGRVVLTVVVSGSSDLSGWAATIGIEGDAFANGTRADATDLTELMETGFLGARVGGEQLRAGFLASLVEPIFIAAGDDTAVAEIEVCLAGGTAPGDYALSVEFAELIDFDTSRAIVPEVEAGIVTVPAGWPADAGCTSTADPEEVPARCDPRDPPDPPDPPGPNVDFMRGDANSDGTISISDSLMLRRFLFNGDRRPPCMDAADANDDGSVNLTDPIMILSHIHLGGAPLPAPYLEVGPDPTGDNRGCDAYDVVAPEETDDVIEIGSIDAAPGEDVLVPVYLTNAFETEAFQLVIEYDSAAFEPVFEGMDNPVLDGAFLGDIGALDEPGYHAVRPLGDDRFVVGLIPSLINTGFEVPPGERRLVFYIAGRVSDTLQEGDEVVLAPTNGTDGAGVGALGLRNEITFRGDARYVSGMPQTIPGILAIVGDVTIFRGDVNHDGDIDVTDAVNELNYLFGGGPTPPCLKAADANDDGELSIVDPIAILNTLFLGTVRIAPPYPGIGLDPTPDDFPTCPPQPRRAD